MKEAETTAPVRKMRKFRVRFEGEVEIEVADELLKSCNTDEWRASMYRYTRDEQFVEHIVYNTVFNDLRLESIDGFADQPEDRVVAPRGPFSVNWDIEAEEIP